MTVRALDSERLVRDLRAAADTVWPPPTGRRRVRWHTGLGMHRAWLVTAAAIEDGCYDVEKES